MKITKPFRFAGISDLASEIDEDDEIFEGSQFDLFSEDDIDDAPPPFKCIMVMIIGLTN